MKSTKTTTAIRLSITPEVGRALQRAKILYPTLSDPEILKLGLAAIVTDNKAAGKEREEIRHSAAYSVGQDYLSDPQEDLYTVDVGRKVHFSWTPPPFMVYTPPNSHF